MKVKVAQLWAYLKQKELTKEDFAKKLRLSIGEVEMMLRGEAVGINTARKFINGLSAETAQDLIDWEAIGVNNPLADDDKDADDEDEDDEDEDFDDFEDFEENEDDLDEYDNADEDFDLNDFADFEAYEDFKYSNNGNDDEDYYDEDDEDETDD